MALAFRKFNSDTDSEFVHNSWLKSYWHNHKNLPQVKSILTQRIKDLLKKSKCVVACDEEYPDIVYGYVIYDALQTHWMYVKYDLRKKGLGTKLAEQVPESSRALHTHPTKAGARLAEKYNSIYNPFPHDLWELMKGKKQ